MAPSWIIQQALSKEHDDNWSEAYGEVSEKNLPLGANVISSHVVYKLKPEENYNMRLKARICPQGNRERMKDEVRKDSTTAHFDVIRLMLAIVTLLPV